MALRDERDMEGNQSSNENTIEPLSFKAEDTITSSNLSVGFTAVAE
jgi:hypothetical protein